VDLAAEVRLASVLVDLASDGTSRSAHDVSTGGMLTTLVESAVAGGVGVTYEPPAVPVTQALFGESPGRVVLTVSADAVEDVLDRCATAEVGARVAGTVGGERLVVAGLLDVPLEAARKAFEGGLAAAVDPA
jgi:phosphoribosylformylglycinamidine synthase